MTSSLPNLLLTGGNGQLARAIQTHETSKSFAIKAYAKTGLDITDYDAAKKIILNESPDYLINCAAYTAVDLAETQTALADHINHLGAKNLALIAKELTIPFIHISTDYIFDGSTNTPYREEDTPNPINAYGKTKLDGENAIRQIGGDFLILRVSGVFSQEGKSFYKTILKLAQEKSELNIIHDQYTCPTHASDIAEALFTIIKKPLVVGTYHFCSTPVTSWHDFAASILKETGSHCKLNPISTAQYKTAARRPAFSVLCCDKIETTYGIKQPSWLNAIRKMNT